MDFQQTLDGFKNAIDREFEHHFNIIIGDNLQKDELIVEALEQAKKIALAGGKRIRGILLQVAYFGVGGKEQKKILKVAVAIEFLHLFFLIHDDVIDHGNLRHGKETVHRFFAKKNSRKKDLTESAHFGDSVAIIVGDMLFAKANEIILKAGFGEKETIAALVHLQSVVETTIVGQSQDIGIENGNDIDEDDIILMHENKTARYTFEGPLQLGAILAGLEDKKIQNIFKQYSRLVGVAFQLQDDMLGVFGKKNKTGKSTVSDIEEGKLSLMVFYAMTNASVEDRKILDGILGKKNLSQKEILCFKDILLKTGAKKYAQNLALKYFEDGRGKIEKAVLLPKSKKFLIGLVGYLEKRDV